MAKFKVYVEWVMSRVITVEADSVDEAIEKVEDDEIPTNVDTDGSYVEDSFDINVEATMDRAAMGEVVKEENGNG